MQETVFETGCFQGASSRCVLQNREWTIDNQIKMHPLSLMVATVPARLERWTDERNCRWVVPTTLLCYVSVVIKKQFALGFSHTYTQKQGNLTNVASPIRPNCSGTCSLTRCVLRLQ